MADALRGFSRFDDADFEDEEDERQRFFEKSRALFANAEQKHHNQGSTEEVLALFQQAEVAMRPFMEGGIAGLKPAELEIVLKGRLHSAVIVAQLDGRPNRWPEVKGLVEDVLQFDFENCHARWLRGLALLHGPGGNDSTRREDAFVELSRAVASAECQGKTQEAQQWRDELQKLHATDATPNPTAPSLDGQGAGTASGVVDLSPRSSASIAEQPSATSSSSLSPLLRRGFLSGGRAEQKRSSASMEVGIDSGEQRAKDVLKPDPDVLVLGAQIIEVGQHLRREHERQARLRQQECAWQRQVERAVGSLDADLDDVLKQSTARRAANEAVGKHMTKVRAAAEGICGQLKASCAWADVQNQRFSDLTASLATVREVCDRDARERQDVAEQQAMEHQRLAARLASLKTTLRGLRGNLRALRGGDSVGAGEDVVERYEEELQRASAVSATFQTLPSLVKFVALVEDSTSLWLAAFAALMGSVSALALSAEGFAAMHCRFVCAATAS
mmetsp:Transcript_21116/g.59030  ORF Transcript_21116/g.59030 Transcript_21116/m.59030 type:complete len:503 (-) Transcript_21116:102-1610(-)